MNAPLFYILINIKQICVTLCLKSAVTSDVYNLDQVVRLVLLLDSFEKRKTCHFVFCILSLVVFF